MNPNSTITLNHNDLIFIHSPLSMLSKFVLFLQERFSQNNLPWKYSNDENETDVFIHTEYNTPQETANAYPRISVGRGSFVHQHKVVQGDLGDPQPKLMKRGIHHHWSMCNGDISIQCISEKRGEGSILGDIVQSAIGMSRTEICKQFGLHEISSINFQATQPYERDQDKWRAPIQFRIKFAQRWLSMPIAPELSSITLRSDAISSSDKAALAYIKSEVI